MEAGLINGGDDDDERRTTYEDDDDDDDDDGDDDGSDDDDDDDDEGDDDDDDDDDDNLPGPSLPGMDTPPPPPVAATATRSVAFAPEVSTDANGDLLPVHPSSLRATRARRGSLMWLSGRRGVSGGGGGAPSGGGCCHFPLLAELWKWAASVVLIYVVTIAIFPSLTSTIVAAPLNWTATNATHTQAAATARCEWEHVFVPLGFVVFNLGDTLGRNCPWMLRSPNAILLLVLARVVFAPLFMLCHTAAGGALELPLFSLTDALPFVLMGVFSFSNGWLTSSVFVASQGAIDPARRDFAASLLMMMLNAGIFAGAALSFVVRFLDCQPSAANNFDCNPFITPALNGTR